MRHTKIDDWQLKRLYKKELSDRNIAKELSRIAGHTISQSGVSRARHRLGLKAHRKGTTGTNRKPEEMYETMLKRGKEWKEANPERVKKNFKKWQKKNRERLNGYMRIWRTVQKLLQIEKYNKEFYANNVVPARVLLPKARKNLFIRGLSKIGGFISKLFRPWRKWLNSPKN